MAGSVCTVCRRRIPSGSRCDRHAVRSPSNRAWHRPGAARARDRVLSRGGGSAVCGAAEGLTVHHVVGAAEGGGNDPGNLVAVCKKHHEAIHRGEIELAKPVPQ